MIEIRGLYNTALCYTSALEEKAAEQIRTVCDQEEFAGCRIRIMPDVHAGKGLYDRHDDDDFRQGRAGHGRRGHRLRDGDRAPGRAGDRLCRARRADPPGRSPAAGTSAAGSTRSTRRSTFPKLRCAHSVSLDWARRSIGTLGGGNHFIEIDRAENGALYLVVHSGSRYLGTQVCAYYQEQGQLALRRGARGAGQRADRRVSRRGTAAGDPLGAQRAGRRARETHPQRSRLCGREAV